MDINGALLQITLVAEEEEIRHPALAAYFAEKGADPSHIPHLISLLHGIPPSLPLSVLEATGFPESLSLVSERVQSLFTKVFPEFHINAEHFKQAFITEQLTRAIAIDEAVRRLSFFAFMTTLHPRGDLIDLENRHNRILEEDFSRCSVYESLRIKSTLSNSLTPVSRDSLIAFLKSHDLLIPVMGTDLEAYLLKNLLVDPSNPKVIPSEYFKKVVLSYCERHRTPTPYVVPTDLNVKDFVIRALQAYQPRPKQRGGPLSFLAPAALPAATAAATPPPEEKGFWASLFSKDEAPKAAAAAAGTATAASTREGGRPPAAAAAETATAAPPKKKKNIFTFCANASTATAREVVD